MLDTVYSLQSTVYFPQLKSEESCANTSGCSIQTAGQTCRWVLLSICIFNPGSVISSCTATRTLTCEIHANVLRCDNLYSHYVAQNLDDNLQFLDEGWRETRAVHQNIATRTCDEVRGSTIRQLRMVAAVVDIGAAFYGDWHALLCGLHLPW